MVLKNYFRIAALLFVAVLTGCSSDDLVETGGNEPEVSKPKTIPFTTTIGPKDDFTRGLEPDSKDKTLITTWDGTERIAIVVNGVVTEAEVTNVKQEGKRATIEGEVSADVQSDDKVELIFPAEAVAVDNEGKAILDEKGNATIKPGFWRNPSSHTTLPQEGTLAGINGNFNVERAEGTLIVAGEGNEKKAAMKEISVDFFCMNPICKFTFKLADGTTLTDMVKLVIHLDDEEYSKKVSKEQTGIEDDFYVINLAQIPALSKIAESGDAGAEGEATEGLANFYVAMAPTTEKTSVLFHVKAADGKTYEKTANLPVLEANNYYRMSLTLNKIDDKAISLGFRTKWADRNLGNYPENQQENPEKIIGDLFAWGETRGWCEKLEYTYTSTYVDNYTYSRTPRIFNWATYEFVHDSKRVPFTIYPENSMDETKMSQNLIKYCMYESSGYEGFTDKKSELELVDDAVYNDTDLGFGHDWRMPTKKEMLELKDNSLISRKTGYPYMGYTVSGMLFTSKKYGYQECSIFLPAAGYSADEKTNYSGTKGFRFMPSGSSTPWGSYWTSTLFRGTNDDDKGSNTDGRYANCLSFYGSTVIFSNYGEPRYIGRSIRGVLRTAKEKANDPK